MSFHDLGLSPELLQAIEDLNYTTPTPIQEKAIPYVLMGRDVIGVAQTGTGKTASFTLPMIDALSGGQAKARMPRSVILSPTRELAAQIAANFDQFTKYQKLTKALLIGGESMDEQLRVLDRGVDVLIATPGRLLDLFERGKLLLKDIKIFVIDEADRMLDMGFIPDIERIGSLLPPLRQTLLFSATMPPEIKRLASKFLSNPKEVAVAPPATVTTTVTQNLIRTTAALKRQVLRHLLAQDKVESAMIFCNRKRDVQIVADSLKRHGINVAPLHGDLPQPVRMETLEKFRSGEIAILVCSDVAARGLDVKGVSHVFNFDVPFNAEDYVHRIGRTGRAGQSGIAFTLMTEEDEKLLVNIHAMTKQEIPLTELTDFTPDMNRLAGKGGPGRSGDRNSRDRGGRDRGGRGGKDRGGKPRREHSSPAAEATAPVQQAAASIPAPSPAPAPAASTEPANPYMAGHVSRQDEPRAPRSQHQQRQAPRKEQSRSDSNDGPEVNGFGDDMPEFLQRGPKRTIA